jgi:DNA-binding MarR family transcriptional regulator
MDPVSPTLAFCLHLAQAHNAVSRRFNGELGQGLSFADFVVLLCLSRAPEGGLRRLDLATQLGVTASAVTKTLIPLEKVGLVNRIPDAQDARSGYAALTVTGRRILAEAMPTAEQLSRDVFGAAKDSEHELQIAAATALLRDIARYQDPSYRWVRVTDARR